MNRPDVRLQSILFAVTFHLANGRCPCKRFPRFSRNVPRCLPRDISLLQDSSLEVARYANGPTGKLRTVTLSPHSGACTLIAAIACSSFPT
jgi:hypothetical protein